MTASMKCKVTECELLQKDGSAKYPRAVNANNPKFRGNMTTTISLESFELKFFKLRFTPELK